MKAFFLTIFLPITAVALVAAYCAIESMNVSGIYMNSWTEEQLTRYRCPLHLIQPEWVSAKPDRLTNWIVTETKARLGLIALFWLGAMVFASSIGRREDWVGNAD